MKHTGRSLIGILLSVALLVSSFGVAFAVSAEEPVNIALGKTYSASTTYSDGYVAAYAFDGDANTAWASVMADYASQWIQVDLKSVSEISGMKVTFEKESIYKFKIETSADGNEWTVYDDCTAAAEANRVYEITAAASARYVKMSFAADSEFPFIYEWEVYGVEGTPDPDEPVNIATGKKYSSSTEYNSSYLTSYAFDGNAGTRWASVMLDYASQWIQVDLRSVSEISGMKVTFENAGSIYKFKIETSADGSEWTVYDDCTAAAEANGVYEITAAASARYVKMSFFDDTSAFPSIYEWEVYGVEGTPVPDEPEAVESIGLNVALNKASEAYSEYDPALYAAAYAFDGVVSNAAYERWAAVQDDAYSDEYLWVDLGAEYSAIGMNIFFEYTNKPYNFKIETSLNNTDWDVYEDCSAGKTGIYYNNTAVTVRYAKISFTGGGELPSVQEWEIITEAPETVQATGTNVALKQSASSATVYSADYAAFFAFDGVISNEPGYRWAAKDDKAIYGNEYLQIDLGQPHDIIGMNIFFERTGSEVYKFRIETSMDNTNWKVLQSYRQGITGGVCYNNTAVTAQFFRICFEADSHFPSVQEWEIFEAAPEEPTVTVDEAVADVIAVEEAEDGTVTVTVTGQLAAGSLQVVDKETGAVVAMPKRAGFRTDDVSNVFTFAKPDVSVVVKATEFTATDKPNMGLEGWSTNAGLSGLRSVYRMYVTEEDGKYYTTIGGEKKEVVEYGVLVSVYSDMSKAKKADFTKTELRYDVCGAYQDLSVTVTGLNNGYEDDTIYSQGYLLLEGDQSYYTEIDGKTYADAVNR